MIPAIIPEVVYALWCVFWAYANAKAIQANQHILHGANGLVHLAVCIYFGFRFGIVTGLILFFTGRFFFDVALNLFRGLPIGYVPKNPISIADRLEIKVFGNNGTLPKIVYGVCLVILFIIQILHR